MTSTTETARALLFRHGVPEDVIDGVLCLHAQELATVQRKDAAVWGVDTAAGKHILAAADLIDPTLAAPPPVSSSGRAALLHETADRLEQYIDRYRSPSIANWTGAVAFLRRLADEEQPTGTEGRATAENRAAVLREAIDVAREEGHRLEAEQGIEAARGARSVAYLLRKLLVKAQPAETDRTVAYRSPGTRKLYCVICVRQEHGWDPVAAAQAQDDAACDFCGGRVLRVASRTLGSVVARYASDDPATEERPVVVEQPDTQETRRG